MKKDTGKAHPALKPQVIEEVKELVAPEALGRKKFSITFSKDFEETILTLLGSSNPSGVADADLCKSAYDKLRKHPKERCYLENIHVARAHKYGLSHLGSKSWYKEAPGLAKKFKTQTDRRKLRAGLKGDVYFVNQLNLMDFDQFLKAGRSDGLKIFERQEPVLPSDVIASLKEVPPIELLKLVK